MTEATRFTPGPLERGAPFYIAGHRGLAGSALWRALAKAGFTNLIGRGSHELDLKDRNATFAFFRETKPRYVVLAAAKVGGIMANNTYPADFLSENLQIQVNVLDAAQQAGSSGFYSSARPASTPSWHPSPSRRTTSSPVIWSRPMTLMPLRKSPASSRSKLCGASTG